MMQAISVFSRCVNREIICPQPPTGELKYSVVRHGADEWKKASCGGSEARGLTFLQPSKSNSTGRFDIVGVTMNRANFTVRISNPGDAAIYDRLMSDAFAGKWHSERFRWQYSNELSHSTLFVAEIDGEAIGMTGLEMRPLSNGLTCGVVIDMVVGKPWRRKGLLRLIEAVVAEHARRSGASVMSSLPNPEGAGALGRMAGWSIVAPLPLLYRPAGRELPGQLEAAAENTTSPLRCSFQRDARYRAWRYDKHPHYRYKTLSTQNGVSAVVKLFGSHPTEGDIIEIFGSIDNVVFLEAGYRLAVQYLLHLGANSISTWGMLPEPELQLLLKLGWEVYSQHRYLAVKPLELTAAHLTKSDSWRIQPADIEHF